MKEVIKNPKTPAMYQKLLTTLKTMLSYCLKCRKSTESKSLKVAKKQRKTKAFIISLMSYRGA